MSLVGILVALVLFGVVYWGATKIMDAFKIDDPIRTLVIVLIVIVGVLFILGQISGVGPKISLY